MKFSDRNANLSSAKQTLLQKRLAAALESSDTSQTIQLRPDPSAAPMSFAQERLWFLSRMEPDNPANNRPFALRFKGMLNVPALERAFSEILNRHHILRTRVSDLDGFPVQKISPPQSQHLSVVDLSRAVDPSRRAMTFAAQESQKTFVINDGPLMREFLLRLGENDHVLLVVPHHMLFDAWSAQVFIREIGALYDAFVLDKPFPLQELPIQYPDYAYRQRRRLEGGLFEKQLSYWKEKLTGAPPYLELPTDYSRPAIQTYRGAKRSMTLSSWLTDSLHDLSRKESVTLFMTLLAGFAVLLYRYTNHNDMVLGTPTAGRPFEETQGLIGFFVNILALRIDLSGSPSFRQMLGRIKETAIEAFSHQDLPFEKLVEELHLKRNSDRSQLFQVMFNLENVPRSTHETKSVIIEEFDFDPGTAPFDLDMEIIEGDEGLSCTLTFNTALFDPGTAERMLGHYESLLQGIVNNPDQRLADLPLLTEAERRKILIEWNVTQTGYQKDICIHHLFEAQVNRSPDATAVVFGTDRLTYQELNTRSNRLAHYLRSLGVGPETLVGVFMERSLEMVVSLYGILKAGGAYVPLDPEYPSERVAFMLEDTAVSVLLTQAPLIEKLSAIQNSKSESQDLSLICLDSEWDIIAQENTDNPVNGANAENLAYVIYTSGSTGQPKGVMNEHRGICNRLLWMQDAYSLTQEDRVLQKTPFSFDVSVWEFFWPLLFGARLVIAKPGGHRDSEYLVKLIVEHKITTLHFVPSMLQAFLLDQNIESCQSLKRVICSGEALPYSLQERFFSCLEAELHNLYGPTEAAVDVTYWACQRQSELSTVPIGRPVANTQIYLLDSQLQPVPIGEPGELHIGGFQVARGYLNRPELTSEKFIPDPFFPDPNARLYKTGDLARYLPDGNILYLGRLDHQVKIRGNRIELGEIEAILSQHSSIREVVAVAQEYDLGDKRLAAYVVPKQEQSISISQLRDFLRKKLPQYMIPASFTMLDTMPLTPNGKVDQKALPIPQLDRSTLASDFVAPRNATEETLANIWAQVIGLERVGINDNFFDLGGHSLLATRIMSSLQTAFQVDLPLRILFESPTVAGLTLEIPRRQSELAKPSETILPRDKYSAPLSFAQQRLWFLDKYEPNSPAYNISNVFQLKGAVNVTALKDALKTIVDRHEVLRTTFDSIDGKPVQVIRENHSVELPIIDFSNVSPDDRDAEVQALLSDEVQKPFELSSDVMLRSALIKLNAEGHVLIIVIHHIATDGWSMGILWQELSALYNAYCVGDPSPLPDLPIQYADFAVWQRERLHGEGMERQLSYWKTCLKGASGILELPTDHPRPSIQTYRGAQESFTLPRDLTSSLKNLCRLEGVTLFMILLAAFKVLLYRYTDQKDILVGTPIANRNQTEIEGLIGFFVNTLVLRTDLSGNPTFRDLLKKVKNACLDAYAHQDLPFERLVEELQPQRDLSHSPLFQVMFSLQNVPRQTLELSNLTLNPFQHGNNTTKFDLSIDIIENGEHLGGQIGYNTDLFDQATIKRMSTHFQVLLEGIVVSPDQILSELPILTQAEQHQLLVEWNDTEAAYPKDQCLHELFEAQVERTPDVVAVVYEQQHLTYRELNTRANQLAHYLRKQGVGPEVLVGIRVERSLEMVIGLLGILKAGGAYVPLDPSYPRERLVFMIEDSGIPVLVNQKKFVAGLPSEHQARVVCLDTEWDLISQDSEANPVSGLQPENLAYLIYTSGSTGKPKGVLISHDSITNHCHDIQRYYKLNSSDRVLQFASFNFDTSLEQIFPALIAGAAVIMRGKDVWAPQEFYKKIAKFGITVIDLPPAYWQQFVQECFKAPELFSTNQLKLVIVGGDVMLPEALNLWQQLPTNSVRLINAYGPTETTITATTFEITHGFYSQSSTINIPIGRPLGSRKIYILDAYGNPVPIGIPGELHIGGAGLARGYLNRPNLTEEKFIPDPFGDEPGARFYKTGDLARYLPDGNIEFLGRMDHQVKIRGFRIELGEIEAVLNQHPAVRETVAVVREDRPGDKRLAAYVVPNSEQSVSPSELRNFLKAKLPDYMVPSSFVMMDALPLIPNGKVDRKALPVPDQTRPELDEAFVAPRTPVEETLAEIWVEILQVERVGIHDNFFDLGGHSLIATQIMSKLRDAFNVDLPLRALFETPTIAEIAEEIEQSLARRMDPSEMKELLDSVEELSDEEAKRIFNEEMA